MSKFIRSNLIQLNHLKDKVAEGANKTTQKRINEIIKLYQERKIGNIATAENLIKGLTSKNKKTYEKAFKQYKDTIPKTKKAKPLNERLAETKSQSTYLINFQLYTTRKPRNEKVKPAFKKFETAFYIENFDIRQATVKAKNFDKGLVKNLIFRFETKEDFISKRKENANEEFEKVIELLNKDKDFKEMVDDLTKYYDNLFDAIKIQQVEVVNKKGEKFNIMDESLTDISHISIYHRYVSTPVNHNLYNLREAISNNEHVDNQCWINALSDFYKDSLMNDKRRDRLTRERIIEIIGRNDFYSNGATINEMDKVFKHYRIPARIFDCCENLIYRHEPEEANKKLKCFYAFVKNSHIYTMNNDLKSIQQKLGNVGKKPIVKATTDYHINEKEEPPQFIMIRDAYEILKLVSKGKEPITKYLVPEDNNLTKILFQILGGGYEPKIRFQAGIVSEIRMKLKKTTFIVKTQNLIKTSSDGCMRIDNEETYNNMNKAMFDFNKSLFNPLHKSFYNQADIDLYEEAKTIVPVGMFVSHKFSDTMPKVELDMSKAFTKSFIDIVETFGFNQFDVWQPYTEQMDFNKMHDYTLYYVKNTGEKNKVMLNKKFGLLYGLYLKQLDTSEIKIISYKQPSFKHSVIYKNIVGELWDKKISENDEEDMAIKKQVAVVNFGLLERTNSTNQKSILFRNLKEASDFQQKYGGKIHKLTEEEVIFYEMDDDECTEWNEISEGDSYYIVNISDKTKLVNGFVYIKELLLQQHNFNMYQCYNRLLQCGVKPYSVKTDAFVINTEDLPKAKEALGIKAGASTKCIGQWRVNKSNEDIIMPKEDYHIKENEATKIPMYINKKIDIQDEYDTTKIIEKIFSVKHVMIRAKYAGSGKSFICEKIRDLGLKVLFVCPTNKLVQKYGKDATTINKFFSIAVGDEKLEKFDYSNYDCIVFDEIYFNGLRALNKIREFVEAHKDLMVVATGDGKQLKPVSEITNLHDHEVYANHCINKIFKYHIYLRECKRLKTQEDKDKLANIYDDIFINKVKTKQLIEKYFEYTDDIQTNNNNIAYLNDTCKEVSNEIRRRQNRKNEYDIGEVVICREYLKTTTYKCQVNFRYIISEINGDKVKLKEEHEGNIQTIPIDVLRKHFIFSYCYTCHSVQGSSINTGITIFDYHHFNVSKEWLWTAITRATDLNQVRFYRYDDNKDTAFNKQCIFNYLERKVQNYKEQDRAGKRKIDHKNYITAQWLLDRLNDFCEKCSVEFYVKLKSGNITTNLTAQRKSNEQTHTISNCIAYCKKCNCAASDKEQF